MSVTEFKGLDASMIKSLMAQSRSRDTYGPKLLEFVESDEAGINPRDVWPLEFGEKKSSALYQGFNTAVKSAKLGEVVRVLQRDDNVFLLHNERMRVMVERAEAAANE